MAFIHDRVEVLRMKQKPKLSQEKLIRESGLDCTLQTYRNWVTGNTKPNVDAICTLADYFSVPVSHFFDQTHDKVRTS